VFVVVVATILLGMSVAVPLGMASVGKSAIKCYTSYKVAIGNGQYMYK